MVLTYYTIFIIALIFAIPLASRPVVMTDRGGLLDYDALRPFGKSGRKAVMFAFLILLVFLVINCVWKEPTLPDTQMYEIYYRKGTTRGDREIEPTFDMISSVSPTFLALLAIFAILSCGTSLYGILKNSPNIWLSLFAYLSYYYVLHDMIQLRAAVACGIMLIGIRYACERKWWIFFPLCLTAFYFHYSASVFFIFYFLPRKRLYKYFWAALLIGALLFSMTGGRMGFIAKYIPLNFVQNYLESYVGSKTFVASELGVSRVFKVFVALMMLFNLDRIKRHYPYAPLVLILYIFSLLCYLLFGDIPVLQGRMGELFGVAEIFALAMFPLISRKHYYILMSVPIVIILYNHIEGYTLLTMY